MTTYVWHAVLSLKWEPAYDFGLFHNKADAKQACQDQSPDARLDWDNSKRNRSFAKSSTFSDGLFVVTRRPVQ